LSDKNDYPSPWNDKEPSYKDVPDVNPSTGEPVPLRICLLCGAAVINRKMHTRWHEKHSW